MPEEEFTPLHAEVSSGEHGAVENIGESLFGRQSFSYADWT